MVQVRQLILSRFFLLFLSCVARADKDVTTLYIHGFTGRPSGVHDQKIAFPNPEKYQAPAMPDTQKETGFGLNRIVAAAAKLKKKDINLSQAFMGQGADVKTIAEFVEKGIIDEPFILFGICRGGSAAINYVAQYNPKNLKALVIESTPADMPALLHAKMAQTGINQKFDESFFRMLFSAYPKNATPPVKALKNIANKELPILILHSKDDENISFEHSLMLYLSFKDHGFCNVHLVPLQGKHAYSLQQDSVNYLTAVHSFYKQYDLVHDALYAIKTMDAYDYSTVQAQKELKKYQEKLQKQLQKTHKKMAFGIGLMGATVYAWNYLFDKKQLKNS